MQLIGVLMDKELHQAEKIDKLRYGDIDNMIYNI
jgi:hypothetical protein